MNYFVSKYNYYIQENTFYYIYNVISGCIFQLSGSLFDYIQEKDNSSEALSLDRFNKYLINLLLSSRIIYKENENEYHYLKFRHLKDKHDDSYLSLVMLPTLKCNLNCHYCYEKDKDISLTHDNIKALKLFFKSQALKRKYINIRWSGGEIMTSWKKIKYLSEFIIEQCQKHNCGYSASAISNGSLLTLQAIEDMCNSRIRSIQITLDGPKEIHDKVRFFKNGKGTFNSIINNIEVASYKLKVIIRINVDKNNFNSMELLFKALSNANINKENVQLFCKPVLCTSVRTPVNKVFSHKEFYEVEKRLLQLAKQYNLPYSFHWGVKGSFVRCAYANVQGYYISPDLSIYKCPIYIDQGHKLNSIGYISTDGEMVINNYEEYLKSLSYSPFNNEECLGCKVLPICHGKCPIMWEVSGRKNDEGCIPEKYSIIEKIKYAINNPSQMHAYKKSGIL